MNAKTCKNGLYKVGIEIPCDRNYMPYFGKMGKVVMGQIISEKKIKLISYEKHDETWTKSDYKNLGYFEKIEDISKVNFFSPN